MAEHEKPAPETRQESPAKTTVAAQKSTAKEKIKTYIKAMPKRYFITAFSGMATFVSEVSFLLSDVSVLTRSLNVTIL